MESLINSGSFGSSGVLAIACARAINEDHLAARADSHVGCADKDPDGACVALGIQGQLAAERDIRWGRIHAWVERGRVEGRGDGRGAAGTQTRKHDSEVSLGIR